MQLVVWLFVFRPALREPVPPVAIGADQPVSVIVCYRDEADHLEDCLRGILAQDHPTFEVVAVDDGSEDDSAAIVERLREQAPHLRAVRPDPTRPGKKDALSAGIAAARHPLMVLTDADCVPASPQWLRQMSAPLAGDPELVLGCSPYRRVPGVLNYWQRFESTSVLLQYQGLARLGMPYMGTGRNLAYTRDFFERSGGLESHADVAGGDDDLIVNANAQASRTTRVTDPMAWTLSAPTADWESYVYQKARHQSVGLYYRMKHKLLLAAIGASHGVFYLSGFVLLFTTLWPWALALYGLRALAVLLTYLHQPVATFLGGGAGAVRASGVPGLLLCDALYSFHYVFLLLASFGSRQNW